MGVEEEPVTGEREEALVAEAREDPALNDFNSNFDFGFIGQVP